MGRQAVTSWERLTSAELGRVDRGIPVVLPLGAVEQHGPHLPLATDRIIAEHFRARLDEELGGDVLTLPATAVGFSGHHRDFPGTLSVWHDTLLGQITGIADCVLGDGFRGLLLLNAHGGNEGVAQVAMEQLGFRWPGRDIVRTTWWRAATPELTEISDTGPGGCGHACELETSLMLAISPELVDLTAVPERTSGPAFGWDTADMLRSSRAAIYRRFADIAHSGVFGEPLAASADKGHAISRAVTEQLVTLIRSLRSGDTTEVAGRP